MQGGELRMIGNGLSNNRVGARGRGSSSRPSCALLLEPIHNFDRYLT